MKILRAMGRLPVFLALLLFGAWLCAGWLHEHPGASNCQVCKELAASAAEDVRCQSAPDPPCVPEQIAAAVEVAPLESFAVLPHGRAPPSA